VKFTPKNGLITSDVNYIDGYLCIKVSDNGIGMNEEVKDKIFKPFEQADGSTTRKYGGTGLGLSITKTLTEMMGGTIELESQEGVGSTFTVRLKLDKLKDIESEDDIIKVEIDDKEDTLSGHVLIVEDNQTNQMLVKILIEDFGLTCDIVNDGLEAIEIYNPQKHVLILMDENMPNMNGTEAMKIIKEKCSDECGPIIVLTANVMEGDKEKFLKSGMEGL